MFVIPSTARNFFFFHTLQVENLLFLACHSLARYEVKSFDSVDGGKDAND
jgi:hypothetical protein